MTIKSLISVTVSATLSATVFALSCTSTVLAAQTTHYTYNALGLIETVDGPRSDVSDITTYNYNAQGMRSSITNALGHTTQISSYDSNHRPLQWTDANGLITQLAYSNTGELSRYTLAGRTTELHYDAVGNLIGILPPNGSWLYLLYDDARRLIQIEDIAGNTLTYTRDLAGNLTNQQTHDAQGQLVQTQQRVFDELSRLIQTLSGTGNSDNYQYDNNDNLSAHIDAKNQTTTRAYDALNRLVTQTNALNDNTQYQYDSADNLIEVIDPKGLITQYRYDSYGNQISQNSLDTGLTTFAFDNANNAISQTDARGITVNYAYDALNRLTQISYPNSSYNITYTYDVGAYAIGHLSSVIDASGTTQYSYNNQGELITQTRVINSQSYTIQYAYNSGGLLSSLIYPSGKVLNYSYNANAQMSQITLDDNGQITTLMSNASYLPFGRLKQLTFGNTKVLNKTFDLDYQQTNQQLDTLQSINYTFDPLGNVINIQDSQDITQNYTFDYDTLSRLIGAQNVAAEFLYAYDSDGNRLQLSVNGELQDYSYPSNNNHLTGTSGSMGQSFSYDAVGNLISTDTRLYTYGDNNRLVQVEEDGQLIANYTYNALGQRSSKVRYFSDNSVQTTHYLYDTKGNLLAEHNGSGESLSEYIYLNGQRLAMVVSGSESVPFEIILDNSDNSTVFSGNWTVSTATSGFEGANYQYHRANGTSPDGDVIDNTDAAFSVTGNWAASTSASGYEGSNYQFHSANGASPDGVVIDNSDSAFTTTGSWTASTSVSGYDGANYQYHSANGASPDGIVIDNTDSAFSTTGSWTASTSASGFEGSNYQFHSANGVSPDGMELDNSNSSVITIGSWNNSTSASGYLGSNYQYAPAGTGTQSLTWTADVAAAGQYHVYARWTASNNRASNAPYTITHSAGQSTVTQNQKQNGSQWNLLGTYDFDQASTTISLSNDADGYVIADGIKLVPVGALPNIATWTIDIPSDGKYTVYAKWTASSNRASNAQYTITHKTGDATITQNQKQNGGQWNSLGEYQFTAGQTTVSLTDVADGYVIADSIKVVPEGALPNIAIWTIDIPSDGNYTVYAKWTASSNRASNASYRITHSQGQSTSTQNQKLNGGQWNSLGEYQFTAGQSTVTLTDQADGYVIADSIKLVPEGALPNTATWTVDIPSDGSYTVYAKWTASNNRASNAQYTIIHATGDATLTQNQKQNGGQWNSLGQYQFIAGQTTVSLTDQADGYVIADGIKLVPEGAAPNRVTWNPDLIGSSEYEVYAKWTASSNRTSNAAYTITHTGGDSTITQNQKLNGGQWNLLGTYTLDSLSSINLTDQGDGYVIADSLKLIPTGNSVTMTGGIYYIHTDHLDTPQLMTNTNGDVVWSSNQTPFGQMLVDEDPDGDGQNVTLNFRFPGQYYDEETGFYYNYWRYYDPELGRYITSDPIGLGGGINTYAYVLNNPTNFIDPKGLEARLICRPVAGTGRDHCFVTVTIPDDNIYKILSLFGDPNKYPPLTTGKKSLADFTSKNLRDDPFSPNNTYNQIVKPPESCANNSAPYQFERKIMERFMDFPTSVPYYFFGPNSNSFTENILDGNLPNAPPTNAPGFGYGW